MATTVTNMLTWVGYRLSTTIGAATEPSQAECIQWINEVVSELTTVCAEAKTEVGRTTASITLADGSATYTDLALVLLAPYEMLDDDGQRFCGWIEKTSERIPLKLVTEQDSVNYNPSTEREPVAFYVNGANGLVFLDTPDTAYTAKIPYYPVHTVITAVGNTIPFLGIFDNTIIESVTMRSQNRDEYDLSFELKWFSYIRGQARKILAMRRSETTRIKV
jgi:hypothetical protein